MNFIRMGSFFGLSRNERGQEYLEHRMAIRYLERRLHPAVDDSEGAGVKLRGDRHPLYKVLQFELFCRCWRRH